MKKSLPIISLSALALISACGGPQGTVSEMDKTQLDCLASKTVVQITDAVRTAIESGEDPANLSNIQENLTAEGAENLGAALDTEMHQAYFRHETNKRLTAMQNALSNRAPNSPDQKLMDATFELASSCSVEAS